MNRSITDIRESGLLELFVLGDLPVAEHREVEEALLLYPELRADVREIERALEGAAFAKTRPPRPEVLQGALRELDAGAQAVDGGAPSGKTSGVLAGVLGVLALGAVLAALYLWHAQGSLETELAAERVELEACLAKQEATEVRIATLDDLQRSDNRVVSLQATEAYAQAALLLYDNPTTGRNYLTVAELPSLPPGKVYQLWSLKEGLDPIPLDVFTAGPAIVPVSYEAGTGTYAITVEQAAGAQVPDLEQLVGTLVVSG